MSNDKLTIVGIKDDAVQLAYGENRWQSDPPPAYYRLNDQKDDPLALHRFKLLNPDKPGGVVNLLDLDRALQTITHIATVHKNFTGCGRIAVAVKHGNPCGAVNWPCGVGATEVAEGVIHGDPLAVFGGVVMTNFTITDGAARALLTCCTKDARRKRVLAGIAAPDFTDEATAYLDKYGGKRCKLWKNPGLEGELTLDRFPRIRSVRGGFIVQPNYDFVPYTHAHYMQVRGVRGGSGVEFNLLLAWAIGSTSNSNTVTIVHEGKLIGNGVGQQDRVGAAELAVKLAKRSGHHLNTGAVAYSDSFFPFSDGVKVLADAGIKYILASSGSINDKEVIAAANEMGVTLYLMPDENGRGFFGH